MLLLKNISSTRFMNKWMVKWIHKWKDSFFPRQFFCENAHLQFGSSERRKWSSNANFNEKPLRILRHLFTAPRMVKTKIATIFYRSEKLFTFDSHIREIVKSKRHFSKLIFKQSRVLRWNEKGRDTERTRDNLFSS